jgi:DNA-directed RNA polymerase specialized sigma subunit
MKKQLQEECDIDLIKKIRNKDCGDSLSVIIKRHGGLYCSIISRMCKKYNNWTNSEDLFAERDYVIYQSAIKYDASKKIKFSTYIGNQAKWTYLNKSNKTQKIINKQSRLIENLEYDQNTEEKHCPLDTLNLALSILNDHPDKRILKLFELRYKIGKKNKEMTWHLVGENMSLSAQGCINLHKIGILYIQSKLRKEGILC